jgi:hypothetical protein
MIRMPKQIINEYEIGKRVIKMWLAALFGRSGKYRRLFRDENEKIRSDRKNLQELLDKLSRSWER